jgi:hypothetical protein
MPAPEAIASSVVLLVLALVIGVVAAYTSASPLSIAAWSFSFYPILPLSSLYATWLTAWFALGHRPRPYSDDPKYIGFPVDMPYFLTWTLLSGTVPVLLIGAVLVLAEINRSAPRGRKWTARIIALLVVPPLVWSLAYLVLQWDPWQVRYWYFD